MDRIEKLRMKENKRAQEITAQEIIKQKTEESEVVGQEKTEQKTVAPEVKTQENTEIRFTPAQQACIDERGKDILVSAAAGSGKTAVLVERIIQLILDTQNPVDIDELLVVTFTKAAAAQMKEKVAKAVAKRLEQDPGNEHLERQAALVHNAPWRI